MEIIIRTSLRLVKRILPWSGLILSELLPTQGKDLWTIQSHQTISHLKTYQATIWIENPFLIPLSATLAQSLPPGIIVLSTDGTLQNSVIRWTNTIATNSSVKRTFAFTLSTTPGAQTNLPAPSVTFNDLTIYTDVQRIVSRSGERLYSHRCCWRQYTYEINGHQSYHDTSKRRADSFINEFWRNRNHKCIPIVLRQWFHWPSSYFRFTWEFVAGRIFTRLFPQYARRSRKCFSRNL